MTNLQTGQLSHNQGVESSDILTEDMQGSNRLPDERSFLDKSFEIAAPVIKQGIGRMVLETGRGINWLVELTQPAEAEASGSVIVRKAIKALFKSYQKSKISKQQFKHLSRKIVQRAKSKIPAFQTTEDALSFGKTATKQQIAELKRLREVALLEAKKANIQGNFQLQGDKGFEAQLYREAIEVAEKKMSINLTE